MSKIEIERKFLLKSLPKIDPDDSIDIEQLYLYRNNIWERVRSWKSQKTMEEKFIHTVKTSISKSANIEDEKFISKDEFETFKSECFDPKSQSLQIFKTRHIYPMGKLYWEVDEFHNDYRLIIAEIEIPKKNYKVVIPKYISDLILLEVTGIKQFSNRNLSLKIN